MTYNFSRKFKSFRNLASFLCGFRIYNRHFSPALQQTSLMNIQAIPLGPFETNAYLCWLDDQPDAVLFDAPPGAGEYLPSLLAEKNLKLTDVYLTHGHWDHFAGLSEMDQESFTTWLHEEDRVMVENPEVARAYVPAQIPLIPAKVDKVLEEGETIEILGLQVELRHVPGHCPGSILFYFAELNMAIVGDAIFRGSIGRTDLPGGDFEVLEKSIKQHIYTLPPDTRLLPGHGPETRVAFEMQYNPFVRP